VDVLVDVVGWIGAAMLLLAYGLLAARRLADGRTYHVLNVLGAAGLTVNGAAHGAWPSVALNVVWIALGALAVRRLLRSGPSGPVQG
jgi:hypothetical protein